MHATEEFVVARVNKNVFTCKWQILLYVGPCTAVNYPLQYNLYVKEEHKNRLNFVC